MYRLAIVEDEQLILKGLCAYYPWNKMGFEICLQCTDGKQFLDYLNNNKTPDVVLCDIAMPEVDGLTVAETLSEKHPEVFIVFLSGHADFQYAQKAIKFNVFDYLLKPVKYNDILSVFSKIKMKLDKKMGWEQIQIDSNKLFIDRIHEYVNNHLSTVSWKSLSQEMNLSPAYLSALYKKISGKSFSDYLLTQKMQKAHKLLTTTDLKVYEIATELGYTTPKNFTRTFRQYFGKSPRDFKEPSDDEN